MVTAVVPPCDTTSTLTDICIKGVESGDKSGKLVPASLSYVAKTNTFAKNPTYNLPAGGGVSVWRGTSLSGQEVDYAAVVLLRFNFYREPQRKPSASFFGFQTQLLPITIKSGNYFPKIWKTFVLESGRKAVSLEYDNPSNAPMDNVNGCLWTEIGKCAIAAPFTTDQPLAISLQMDNRLTGWLFGRMKDTAVVVKPISTNVNSIRVEGTSINVPSALAIVPLSAIPASPGLSEMDWDKQLSANKYLPADTPVVISKPSNHPDIFEFPRFGLPPELGGGVHEPPVALKGSGMLQAVDKWLQPYGGAAPTWRFDAITQSSFWLTDGAQSANFQKCFGDKTLLNGMMTTNALAYDWGPPQFVDGSLTYRVAGTHLGYDGELFKGTYDLAIKSTAARCLYGFSSAPIGATVSVVSSDGSTQSVATEAVNERDGWLTLSARGFTFSQPTIRIKLSQDQAVAPAPTKAAVSKSITITCVKGKTVKKVIGVNPKCPTGYAKKG